MSHKITVSTLDLHVGMFVSDLDRPWLETPFLMQGLLIESESQIATLQQYCQQVTVAAAPSATHMPRATMAAIPPSNLVNCLSFDR